EGSSLGDEESGMVHSAGTCRFYCHGNGKHTCVKSFPARCHASMAQRREIIPNEGMLLLEETNEKCANEKHCRDLAGSIMVPGYKYLMFRRKRGILLFVRI
ncbi:hypothetical protein, partial [Heyndrickxia coagulans]|uniref:hypothetical protein n=1 Tax=Heyndrickxia coagulans TaxID=1398 RepID=UPI002E1DD95C|nr:hypothetical protein [Heyndrickxia coagulans]